MFLQRNTDKPVSEITFNETRSGVNGFVEGIRMTVVSVDRGMELTKKNRWVALFWLCCWQRRQAAVKEACVDLRRQRWCVMPIMPRTWLMPFEGGSGVLDCSC